MEPVVDGDVVPHLSPGTTGPVTVDVDVGPLRTVVVGHSSPDVPRPGRVVRPDRPGPPTVGPSGSDTTTIVFSGDVEVEVVSLDSTEEPLFGCSYPTSVDILTF